MNLIPYTVAKTFMTNSKNVGKNPRKDITSIVRNENPILLTSDNGLQVKAKGLKIATISLKEFLKR